MPQTAIDTALTAGSAGLSLDQLRNQVLIAAHAARLPAGYCRVLQVLENHSRGSTDTRAWPCQARISRLAQLSVRHVRRILAALTGLGIIAQAGTIPTRRGGRGVIIWRLNIARLRDVARSPIGLRSPDEPNTNKNNQIRRSLRSHGIQEEPLRATERGWRRALARMGSWEALQNLGLEAEKLAARLS